MFAPINAIADSARESEIGLARFDTAAAFDRHGIVGLQQTAL